MIPGVNERAFDNMNYAASDKTAVNLTGDKAEVTSEDVHNMLMAAGVTPGLGNIADIADAILYAAEGEFGQAGLSMAAIIPFIGQAVSAKRALKIAKESGEEMVTLYRGVDQWHPGSMVQEGKFVGGGHHTLTGGEKSLWVTQQRDYAEMIAQTEGGVLLEFEVPISFMKKHFTTTGRIQDVTSEGVKMGKETGLFSQGLPKEFLTKVHK
jgi:hypothetical protein|tara:strand:- start:115 stop:744 length:630 start_codon:yes stop_codon:yes gene_type:complete